MRLAAAVLISSLLTACGGDDAVECVEHSNCDRIPGGLCEEYGITGNKWCTYPDDICGSDQRWSDMAGDGLAGECVEITETPDAGIDASPADASPADASPADASPDGGGSTCTAAIAYHSSRFGANEIYRVEPDGSGTQRLTINTSGEDTNPLWSPNGDFILFSSTRDGNTELYVMTPDGDGETNLTNNATNDTLPNWSWDSSKIVFQRGIQCYTMDANGANQEPLTTCTSTSGPQWSPNGSQVLYLLNDQVYVVNANGSNPTPLTTSPIDARVPRWSPDGTKIVFYSIVSTTTEIFVMDADGGNQVNLTNNAFNDLEPKWSPTGDRIAFTTNRDGNYEVYVMDADGGNPVRLTDNGADDRGARWSPDGQHILFRSDRDGDYEILAMSATDGSGLLNLTNAPGNDGGGSWRTCP